MATLADVKFEDFLTWIGAIESMSGGIQEDLGEAMNAVPLIERLMMVHANAMEQQAPARDLMRSSAIINSLVAIHFIMKGRTSPGAPISGRSRKVHPKSRHKGHVYTAVPIRANKNATAI